MLKLLEKIKASHIIILLLLGVIILLWSRTNKLQQDVIHLITTHDTLITYINELDQRVYDLPIIAVDPTIVNKLAKVDSSYNVLNKRIKALGESQKHLLASLDLVIESAGTVTSNYITNQYYNADSTELFRTFASDDGLLNIQSSTSSKLDSISHDYKLTLGNIYIDIFRRSNRSLDAYLTFANPKLNLFSQRAYIAQSPVPAFTVSAGLGLGTLYANKNLYFGPTLSLHAGIPIYTIYKQKKW